MAPYERGSRETGWHRKPAEHRGQCCCELQEGTMSGAQTSSSCHGQIGPIRIASSDKCLDASDYGPGLQIIQYDCLGNDNQQWRVRKMSGSTFALINVKSGKCLDASDYGRGEKRHSMGLQLRAMARRERARRRSRLWGMVIGTLGWPSIA